MPGGKTVEVDDIREQKERDVNKTVKQNDHKMTDWRRRRVQQENGKRVTRQERSFADVVSQGKVRKARVFMGDSTFRKVDNVVMRGGDITLCVPGANIEDVAEKVGQIMGSDTGVANAHISRTYRDTTKGVQHEHCEIRALQWISHEHIPVTKKKRDQFGNKVAIDDKTPALIKIIRQDWPARAHYPPAALPYYDERSSLIEADGLVYRGIELVVPRSL